MSDEIRKKKLMEDRHRSDGEVSDNEYVHPEVEIRQTVQVGRTTTTVGCRQPRKLPGEERERVMVAQSDTVIRRTSVTLRERNDEGGVISEAEFVIEEEHEPQDSL